MLLFIHLFGSTPDHTILFSNVKLPGNVRLDSARTRGPWQFDLAVFPVLFSRCLLIFLGESCSYGLGEVVERATAK